MTHQATGTGLAVWLVAGLAMAQPAPELPASPAVASASPATAGAPAMTGAASATVAAPSPRVVVVPVPSSAPPASTGGQAALLVPWTPPPVATYTPVSVTTYTTAPGERSYASHLAIADVAALSLAALSLPAESPGPAVGGLGVYMLGAPVVHLLHGNVGRGLLSFGLRVGAPILGGFALYGLSCERGPAHDVAGFGCAFSTGFGAVLGVVGAVAVDYGVLAREKVAGTAVQTVSWSPTIRPSKDGMTLGMAGAW